MSKKNFVEEYLENEGFEDNEDDIDEVAEDDYNEDEYYHGQIDVDVDVIDLLKLDNELKHRIMSMKKITRSDMKTLVDLFYQIQKSRIRLENQIRAIKQEKDTSEENSFILEFFLKNFKIMESNISKVIEMAVNISPVGQWLMQVKGVGPVIAAGIIAYLDVRDKQYASQFISYAGLNDNNRPWLGVEKSRAIVNEVMAEMKTKKVTDEVVEQIALRSKWSYSHIRDWAYNPDKDTWSKDKVIKAISVVPYNRTLKTLMHKCGESFHWKCNDAESVYGTLFTQRRDQENIKNENGEFSDQAANILVTKNIGKDTAAYKSYSHGKLPKAHINARALRWTEKIFLAHVFEEMYRVEYDEIPPRYYILEHGNGQHNKLIEPEVPFTKVSSEK